jgi:hypothetical protein
MSQTSNRFVLGFGLAVLVLEFFLSQQSALATDKISLFKVITTKDEIVIGLTDDELSKIDGRNAGGVAKMLAAKGAMTVWQYAVRKAETGALEQAPLRKIGLMANASLRVEPYTSPLKIVPVSN